MFVMAETPAYREEFFPSKDGTQLFRLSLVPEKPKAVALIVHGYADHCARYKPVMEHLAKAGYAVHAFDYRGHGRAAGRRGFCSKFSEFLDDFGTFLGRVKADSGSLPVFVVAHSHGALVVATYVADRGTDGIRGLVLTGPYFRLQIEPTRFQLFQANVIGRLLPFIAIKNPLTEQQLTRDEAFQRETAADPLRHHVVTPKWFTESNAAQARILECARKIELPMLVMHGEADPVAVPATGKAFVDAAASADKAWVGWPGMRHEIFNELGKEEVLAKTSAWLDAHLGAKA
jgi:alpha-beta hydrolase superfamily lysophospholipase